MDFADVRPETVERDIRGTVAYLDGHERPEGGWTARHLMYGTDRPDFGEVGDLNYDHNYCAMVLSAAKLTIDNRALSSRIARDYDEKAHFQARITAAEILRGSLRKRNERVAELEAEVERLRKVATRLGQVAESMSEFEGQKVSIRSLCKLCGLDLSETVTLPAEADSE